MIIACDMDNVLNNLTEKMLDIYNEHNDKNIRMEDLTAYNFYDCLSKTDADCLIKSFKNKALWDSLSPIEGSRAGLQKLIDAGHKVFIVTATAPDNFAWKCTWMRKYFPFFPTDNIVRMQDKSLFKCDIMVDDHYDNLIKNKLCHKVILDYCWNKDEAKDWVHGTYRCANWTQIIDAVNKIQEEINEWIGK